MPAGSTLRTGGIQEETSSLRLRGLWCWSSEWETSFSLRPTSSSTGPSETSLTASFLLLPFEQMLQRECFNSINNLNWFMLIWFWKQLMINWGMHVQLISVKLLICSLQKKNAAFYDQVRVSLMNPKSQKCCIILQLYNSFGKWGWSLWTLDSLH